MPSSLDELKRKRSEAAQRNDKVERLLKGERKDLKHIQNELKEEREHRDELQDRRRDLREALEEEIRADKKEHGKHPDEWEDWVSQRREELADLIDSSVARIQRLLERGVRSEKERNELIKRDRHLEKDLRALERRIKRKRDPKNNLTKDFSVAEFDCNNGTPCPNGIVPHLKLLCEKHLQPLRNSGGVVGINSGYRTASYNAAIGGEPNSYHIYTVRMRAPAADHVQSGRSASAVASWHDSHDAFDGMGRYASFVHGDDRGYTSRWWG